MYLMFRDIPIMWMKDSINGEVRVYDEKKLPFEMRDRIFDESASEVSLETKYELRGYNRDYIKSWLASRVLSLTRANAKKILNAYCFSQSQDEVTKAKISLSCRAVSILDCYWIKGEKENLQWKDVDIRSIPLSDIMFNVALRGNSLTIQNKELLNPEISTFGAYAKAWKREEDGLYLYKAGERYGKEARIEACVSNILDCMNVRHLKYELVNLQGLNCTKCKCLTTETYSMVPMIAMEPYCRRAGIDLKRLLMSKYADDFYKMCQVDYLIANSDRHNQNWGFYMNNDTFELESLHPLFDHNNSFDTEFMKNEDTNYIAWPGITMKQAAIQGYKRVPLKIQKPIKKEIFVSEKHFDVFVKRVQTLNIPCKIKRNEIIP